MAYSLKHRFISWVSRTFFDNFTYTVRNGLNKGLRRRGGLGWIPRKNETPETIFLGSLDLKNKVVYDIGAFHGLMTMYFARNAKIVVAWEPSSRNRRRLEENLRLNSFANVTVRPYGLCSATASGEISFDALVPGTASLDTRIASGQQHERVELRRLDDETGLEAPDLIKVDVEGFELEVLKGAHQLLTRRPDLFLEMHGANPEDKKERVTAIVEYLWDCGYRHIVHVETRMQIRPENATVASQGHLYARA